MGSLGIACTLIYKTRVSLKESILTYDRKKHLSTWILNELHKKGDPLAIGIDYSETEEVKLGN